MSHPDDEVIAALAAGETVPASVTEHVTGCPTCAEQVSAIRHVLEAARSVGTIPAWTAPPSRVWDAIAAEIDGEPSYAGESPVPVVLQEPAARHTGEVEEATVAALRRPTHRAPRSSRLVRWSVGAAAAGLVLGVAGTKLADRSDQPPTQQVASVGLDTLDTKQRLGEAQVVRGDGSVNLKIDTAPLAAPEDGYLEVWLINTDLKRMVSVGVLRSGERMASFPISADLLSQGYTIVDISREPFDDKPQHSGDSLVRGKLQV